MSDGSHSPDVREPAARLAELLEVIWGRVVGQVNKLIDAHRDFGFVQFNVGLNPTLSQVLSGLQVIDTALSEFVSSGMLGFDERRNAINSRHCILQMKGLNAALNAGDEAEFERIIAELKAQSKF